MSERRQKREAPTGGEARWDVDELLQELADAELGKQVMETMGGAVTRTQCRQSQSGANQLLQLFDRKRAHRCLHSSVSSSSLPCHSLTRLSDGIHFNSSTSYFVLYSLFFMDELASRNGCEKNSSVKKKRR